MRTPLIRRRQLPISPRLSAAAVLIAAGSAIAQDSVATTAGGNDAITANDTGLQQVRYTLDLVGTATSWGRTVLVGPLSKTSRDFNPLFRAQIPGSLVASQTTRAGVSLGQEIAFSDWSAPGAGVNPAENTAPGTVSRTTFDQTFSVGLSDLSGASSNALGLTVGRDLAAPGTLFVTRTVAATSRVGADDTSSLSIGAADAAGSVFVRADGVNTTSGSAIAGQNVLRIDTGLRDTALPSFLFRGGGANVSSDPGASTFVIDDLAATIALPAALPTPSGAALTLTADFSDNLRVDGASPTIAHVDPGTDGLRGNPAAFAAVEPQSPTGGGLLTSIAVGDGSSIANAINLAELAETGQAVNTSTLTLPTPISTTGFSANAAGDARFDQAESQASFRGPAGLVAARVIDDAIIVAATAVDPANGRFIAVAAVDGSAQVTWDIAAWPGKPVLDGAGGNSVASLDDTGPMSVSAPAIGDDGSVYFVATLDGPSPETALIRAAPNNGGPGYELERLIGSGDAVLGENSQTQYTITGLTLADSDGLAAGAFNAQALVPAADGFPTTLAVNASIEYERSGGMTESYEATLVVTVPLDTPCNGDITGNGVTGPDDLFGLLSNFGLMTGATLADGDITGDGLVGPSDLFALLADFGCPN